MANAFEEVLQRRMKEYSQSGGNISGYVKEEEFNNLMQELLAIGYGYAIRTSSQNDGTSIWFSSRGNNVPDIKEFGSPFQCVKTTVYQCTLGPKYYEDNKNDDQSDHPGSKKRRFHIKDTKKIGCPAGMIVKCVQVYEDFSVPKLTRKFKEAAIQKLKEALQSDSPPQGHLRFYIKANVDHTHSEVLSEMNFNIHPSLLEEMEKIIKSGITTTREVKYLLKRFVDNMFGEDSVPNFTNRAFYPSHSVLYHHIYKIIFHHKRSKIDQEVLEREIEKWKSQNCNDNFFFRPYSEEGTLLFCHQSRWQKHLLSRYGQICLLDATYRTTKYSLPLFFLCVKTNVGYTVAATFVIQAETKTLISEALGIIKNWNLEWRPNFFMTDFSETEICALEKEFPDSTVYLCAFHREQAWLRWLRKTGNIEAGSAEDLLTLWRAVADAENEEEYEKSIRKVQEKSDVCGKAVTYFNTQWLPHAHRWVYCYSANDYNTVINTTNGVESQNRVLKHSYLAFNADKTLTGMLKVIIEQFLPDSLRKYTEKNSVSKCYNKQLPNYLHNRPTPFIKHMMSRLTSAKNEIDEGDIVDFEDGLFAVKSCSNPSENYIVNLTTPSCSCADFRRNRLPCKHLCAVFENKPGTFMDLPAKYLNSPYLTMDTQYSFSTHSVENCNNDDHLNHPEEELMSDTVIEAVETPKSELRRDQQNLREKLKMALEMSYLCTDTSALRAATETIALHCSEMAKFIPSSSGIHLLPPDSEGTSGRNYKSLPPKRKRKTKATSRNVTSFD